MLRPAVYVQVYLYADPVDKRKAIDGLSALVELEMNFPANVKALFVFCNHNRDKVKMLCCERNEFIVCTNPWGNNALNGPI